MANYLVYFREFFVWLDGEDGKLAGMSPDDLVAFQGEHRDFQVLDDIQRWIGGKSCRVNTKRFAYAVLRSFFMHNRVPLPQDRSFRIVSDEPRVNGSLSVGEVKRILGSCNEAYRAAFLCMFQGGMGVGELIYWSENGYGDLIKQLREGATLVRLDLPGRKSWRNSRPFYTFIGKDAIEALRIWLKIRGSEEGPIFLNQFNGALNTVAIRHYWLRKLGRLGIIERPEGADSSTRYGKNPHEMRDLFRTQWQKSGAAAEAAEFFMGHNIDTNEYNKAFRDEAYARRQYRKAERWLNILTDDPEKVSIDEVERTSETVEALKTEIGELREMFKIIIEKPELIENVKKKLS
jgi:integrase